MNSLTVVEKLPTNPEFGEIFKIDTRDVSYLTHNFFKYPCKFIPQIPSWALENLLPANLEKAVVYDPFVGSGTTLVEAVLRGHEGMGSDIDPLGRMLTIVKTSKYSAKDLKTIELDFELLQTTYSSADVTFRPEIPNLEHWFTQESSEALSRLKTTIDSLKSAKSKNFFRVVLASVIKKASRADDASPKPYVSNKYSKTPVNVLELFKKRFAEDFRKLQEFSSFKLGKVSLLGQDARELRRPDESVDLAITSPPYINAFDYVRTLRLENLWLELASPDEIQQIRKGNIGTESISVKDIEVDHLGAEILREPLEQIASIDKKRAGIVTKYFQDMELNLVDVFRLLKPGGRYVIVVADSTIRNIPVPTHRVLGQLAAKVGYRVENLFGYSIENRYLRIPRAGRGGIMEVDWIIVLNKPGGN